MPRGKTSPLIKKILSAIIGLALVGLSPGLGSYQAWAATETQGAVETTTALGALPQQGSAGENLDTGGPSLSIEQDVRPGQILDAAAETARNDARTADVGADAGLSAAKKDDSSASRQIPAVLTKSVSGFVQSLQKSARSPEQSVSASKRFWEDAPQASSLDLAHGAAAVVPRVSTAVRSARLKAGQSALPPPAVVSAAASPRRWSIQKKPLARLVLAVALALLSAGWSHAASPGQSTSLLQRDEWGVGLGYGKAMVLDPSATPGLSFSLLNLRWSAPASRLNGWGYIPNTDKLRLLVEPNIGWFHQMNHGPMGGVNIMFRDYLWDTGRFLPFIGLGGGALYTDFNALESRVDFTLLAGAGFDYVINKDSSFQVEYRLHHISNGDLVPPNISINSNYIGIGISRWIGPK